jgi:hypothetical protein
VKQHHPDDASAALAALAAQVDRLSHRVDGLPEVTATQARHGAALDAIAATLARQAADATTPTGPTGRPSGPAAEHTTSAADADPGTASPADDEADSPADSPAVSSATGELVAVDWVSVTDPSVAVATLAQVMAWAARVWAVYDELPACWPWHPNVIAELLACAGSWHAALAEDAGPDAPAAWHDRWRPGAATRISAAARCRSSTWTPIPGGPQTWPCATNSPCGGPPTATPHHQA